LLLLFVLALVKGGLVQLADEEVYDLDEFQHPVQLVSAPTMLC
tara:strand:- start:29415 stop:29543 length:129 start_codon:yes stop_codon:yes gene_type:complete